MNIDKIKEVLLKRDGLSNTLGMEFISTPDPDTCQARMKVDERNRQIFGFLSGGASLALAENLAGVGSLALCPNNICVGINISGSHVKAVLDGDTVTATAHILHKGKTLHQWHVDIRNGAGDLISSVEVTNFVMNKPK
ncbi:MAG: PaaI family thioesterase [Prevotella stercorea]|jgi:1,4-dihydroxy-2-naphthoyl-CoA hydrolase|uniref:PaaI family thioesterase n=1 Tax=Leyella stercorea TaxID=363265 RepID=UPI001F40C18B|nr:PaaI family thioesterase [Leyella stercorea]MCI5988302.1 PaaI family thioesterase [Prevotella sp.]MCF2613790.1 PaaI family thioesterase [Leyella stercorea]MCI6105563.1 PaaI family thioesterase [Prevotella sp.]MCI6131387.1 PaaI family thioesterase [Prevotella sp.]MCI6341024.1 PaaI family thioesterase [Prevotella sp.]